MFKFNLNDEVRDNITRFQGVVIGRTEWLHGCITYTIKSRQLKDGKPLDSIAIDEGQLEIVTASKPRAKTATTGGPTRLAERSR